MQQQLPTQLSAKNGNNSNSSNAPLSLVTTDPIEKATAVQMDLTTNKGRSALSDRHSDRHSSSSVDKHAKSHLANQQHQQLTAAIIQQQNRAIAQQSLEKFGNLSALEKQRVLQQLDKKHYEAVAAAAAAAASASQMHSMHDRNSNSGSMVSPSMSSPHLMHISPSPQPIGLHSSSSSNASPNTNDVQQQSFYRTSPASSLGSHHTNDSMTSNSAAGVLDSNSSTNKDLLALHNGAWTQSNVGSGGHHQSAHLNSPVTATAPIITMPSDSPHNQQLAAAGQEKIIRAFGELMRNMARMKTYIRPSMCKPYGKQSEGLQKSRFPMTYERFCMGF